MEVYVVKKAEDIFLDVIGGWYKFGKKTGLYDLMVEQQMKDEELKNKHTALWVLKHIGIGTLKGLTGNWLSKK